MKKLGVIAIAATVSISAFAQIGFDQFAVTRTTILAPPTTFSGGTSYNLGTNNWVDVRSLGGIAKLDIFARTNTGDSAFTITIQTSNDQTNITTLASVALAIPYTYNYTNRFYGGTNLTSANLFNLYGTVVTPNAAVSGWATPYINALAAPYTNTISGTSISYNSFTTYGVSISDAPSYIRVLVLPTAASGTTNFCFGAIMTSLPAYSSYPF